MVRRPITLKMREGLHLRPIALLVQEANQYSSSIHIESASKKVNAKSIMGMMTLQLTDGEDVTIVAEGPDEEAAIEGVEQFLLSER